MNLIKPLSLIIIIAGILLGGCANQTRHDANQTAAIALAAASQDPGQSTVELPGIELNQDLLFQLLTAEFAVKRGYYDVALEAYLQLAAATRDPRLAQKATRVAIFSRDDVRALEAAKLWVELESNNLEARQAITAAYIRNGNPDAALEHMESVLSLSSADPDQAFMILASLLSREQ